jgi:hypothetical protein
MTSEALFEDLKATKIRVLNVLPGVEKVVPRDALSAWIRCKSHEDAAKPFDNESIKCEHGGIDPTKASETRLISRAAYTLLSGFTTSPDMDICVPCIDREFTARISALDRQEQVAQFDALEDDRHADDAYLVPKSWINLWRRDALKPGVTPTHQDHTLFCEHDRPIENRATKVVAISPAQFMLLRSAIGDFTASKAGEPLCEQCEEAASKESVDGGPRSRGISPSSANSTSNLTPMGSTTTRCHPNLPTSGSAGSLNLGLVRLSMRTCASTAGSISIP